jgi:hypothetical protein
MIPIKTHDQPTFKVVLRSFGSNSDSNAMQMTSGNSNMSIKHLSYCSNDQVMIM